MSTGVNECFVINDGSVYDVSKLINKSTPDVKNFFNTLDTNNINNINNANEAINSYNIIKSIGNISYNDNDSNIINNNNNNINNNNNNNNIVYKSDIYDDSKGLFGDQLPYGEPSWYQGYKSPYYNDTHKAIRRSTRQWVDENIMPFVDIWDRTRKIPTEFIKKAGQAGALSMLLVGGWQMTGIPSILVDKVKFIGGVSFDDIDCFSVLTFIDEICRCGSGGVFWGLAGALGIGLPPVIKQGSEELQLKVTLPCMLGEKSICLAVTEPQAGSDVAAITTTAVKTPCGKYYIINGQKKWITNGVYSDFFTVAVRTGMKGFGGLSLIVVERWMDGVSTAPMKCSGVWCSGTTFVSFENVKVPVENLLGEENKGFEYIMFNFNHERFGMCAASARLSRCCYVSAYRHASTTHMQGGGGGGGGG
eukprot:GHVR01185692.1.p1 GENE.GHVR01185692.1~~GHVR01185692.1.p1  ORF type:complete len:420 (+),score=145.26 GHVR01185692.1:6-1265(+)